MHCLPLSVDCGFVGLRDRAANPTYMTACHSNGLPSLFVMLDTFLSADMQRVIEYKSGAFKSDAMLAPVDCVSCFIPGKNCRPF